MIRRLACLGIICVELLSFLFTPNIVAAASPSLVIYQLQTGASNKATQEFITFYNNTSDPVDVTDWCVTYGSATDVTQSQLGCVAAPEPNIKIMLSSHSSLIMASQEFVNANDDFVPDIVFSAGISGTSGHVRILNPDKQEIDRIGWGSAAHPEGLAVAAHATGKILQRVSEDEGVLRDEDDNATDFVQTTLGELPLGSLYEEELPIDVCKNIEDLQAIMPEGYLIDNNGNCRQDVCLDIDGLQVDVPDGYISIGEGNCALVPIEGATLIINELLPNATSYDTGKEFIEIYNPNDRPVSLDGYILQVAPSFSTSYTFPAGQIIPPHGYQAFSDTDTGLVLPNSNASLRLVAPNGNVVSSSDKYTLPNENTAWALIGQTWQYTNQLTPGSLNAANLQDSEPIDLEEVVSLPPCPTGQYRNTDTNRCRLLAVAVSARALCKEGQERNADTNRCRSVLSSVSNLVPCGAGQERNPATNRCRSITGSTSELAPCSEGQERNPETNRCRKTTSAANAASIAKVEDVATNLGKSGIRWWAAGAAIFIALGYAVYEWRRDIANYWRRHNALKTNSK